jgi:uncharacterized integral membrane protein
MTNAMPNRPTAPPDPAYPAMPDPALADRTSPGTMPPVTAPETSAPGDLAPSSTAPTTTTEPVKRTRTSNAWFGIIVFAVLLVLLLIFILQNTQQVQISYFGADGRLPLAVAMLLAAVAGVLLTALAGSLRIWQLRRHLRRANRQR